MQHDTAFQISASDIRFGSGITSEVGMDLQDMGAGRALLIVDPALVDLPPVQNVVRSLETAGIDFEVFDGVVVEPTDRSFRSAAETATDGQFDSFVAVGGGSTIDAAKAAEVLRTLGGEIDDYFGVGLVTEALQKTGKSLSPHVAIETAASSAAHLTKYSNITNIRTGQNTLSGLLNSLFHNAVTSHLRNHTKRLRHRKTRTKKCR